MKGRAKMKHKAVYYVGGVGDVIGEEDITISLYAQYYPAFITSIDELTEHIKKNGVAHLSMEKDFYPSLEPLDRWWFSEWARNIGKTIKSPGEFNEYHRRYSQSIVGRLVKEIEHLPNNQQAQKLARAITRLSIEVGDTIDRGTRDYLTGNGKPQPADLLSDTRHGELWDSVEKAIIELSTPRAETNADIGAVVRAELRKSKRKSEAKDIKRSQRERAADKIKAEYAKKKTCSFEDAAQWVLCNPTADEKRGGAYDDVTSFTTQLYKDAERLGIKDFIDRKRGRPRKQKAADRRTTQAEGERPPDRARRLPVAVRCPTA